jgi:hypothetical protein
MNGRRTEAKKTQWSFIISVTQLMICRKKCASLKWRL